MGRKQVVDKRSFAITSFERNVFVLRKELLIEEFGEKISRLSHRMIFDNELAREAAQEVWYEIIKNIDSFRGVSSLSTWIYTIAKRTILKCAKTEILLREKQFNEHFELGEIEYVGRVEEKKQWVKEKCDYCLTAFCHCLSNEARLIVLFCDIVELPYNEVSKIMEKSEDTIRQIVSRSRKKIKKFMEQDCILYNPNGSCRCRIRQHVVSVNLDKEYKKLTKAAELVEIFNKFDRELPRKNYWEKIIN